MTDKEIQDKWDGIREAFANYYQWKFEKEGVKCHVRQWHHGERGWFVVDDETYERLYPKGELWQT